MSSLFNCLIRKGDTKDEARIKTIMFPFIIGFCIVSALGLITVLQTTHPVISVIALVVSLISQAIFLVCVAVNAAPAGLLLDCLLGVWVLVICANDLASASLSFTFRTGVVVVLILDAILVFKRDHMAAFVIPCYLIYSFALAIESVKRFGMYDAGSWGSDAIEESVCHCASPPCAMTPAGSSLGFVGMCTVTLGDFYFTRRFANGMRLQLRKVEASVQVAGEVTAALARYDVDAAEKAIDGGEDLPEELAESFRRLLSNLRSYQ
eukprot:Hpha_TRINITY_DN16371_c6_g6::TRINITY_DN16371_c6_g6_i1::g.58563::m.58563